VFGEVAVQMTAHRWAFKVQVDDDTDRVCAHGRPFGPESGTFHWLAAATGEECGGAGRQSVLRAERRGDPCESTLKSAPRCPTKRIRAQVCAL
jgi:hypothetical protein